MASVVLVEPLQPRVELQYSSIWTGHDRDKSFTTDRAEERWETVATSHQQCKVR